VVNERDRVDRAAGGLYNGAMRRPLALLAAAVVAALACYAGLWLWAARELRQGLPGWVEARRAEGYAVTWRSVEVAGFPWTLRLAFTGVSIMAAGPVPVTVTSDRLVLEAAPWNLRQWRFSADQGAAASAPAAGAAAGSLQGTVAASDAGTVVTTSASGISGSGLAAGFAAAALAASVTVPAQAPQSDRDPLLALSVRLDDVQLPQAPPPLAPHIDALALTVTARGRIAPGPVDHALAQWRDQGGTLDIEAAHLAWGGISIDLDGTLALDASLQPEGALTATIAGADKLIDASVAAGTIDRRGAGFARSVMHAIALPGANGDTVRLPLSLQDRRLYVGPAPIAALPQVNWR
jgi:hypothetical protein